MTVAIIQARMSSQRLPGKVLADLGGRPLLGWVVRAAQESSACNDIIVATSDGPDDDVVADAARTSGARVFRGDRDDVLTRFIGAATDLPEGTAIVRLTADCPLLDPEVIRMAVALFEAGDLDYVSTTRISSLPRGFDVEVTHREALLAIDPMASGYQRAHVTPALYENPTQFKLAAITFEPRADDLRVTVDTQEDLEAVRAVVEIIGDNAPRWRDVVSLLRSRPDIAALNADVQQKALRDG